jgi:hypothetical protein
LIYSEIWSEFYFSSDLIEFFISFYSLIYSELRELSKDFIRKLSCSSEYYSGPNPLKAKLLKIYSFFSLSYSDSFPSYSSPSKIIDSGAKPIKYSDKNSLFLLKKFSHLSKQSNFSKFLKAFSLSLPPLS